MLQFGGFFDHFPKTDSLAFEKVARWISKKYDPKLLENILGNKLLYPQTVPIDIDQLDFDFGLLRELIRLNPKAFSQKPNWKEVTIPAELVPYFPDFAKLALSFIDVLPLKDISTFYIQDLPKNHRVCLVSVLRPTPNQNFGSISLEIEGNKFQVNIGSVSKLTVPAKVVSVNFESKSATLFNKETISIEVESGQLGIMIDSRLI